MDLAEALRTDLKTVNTYNPFRRFRLWHGMPRAQVIHKSGTISETNARHMEGEDYGSVKNMTVQILEGMRPNGGARLLTVIRYAENLIEQSQPQDGQEYNLPFSTGHLAEAYMLWYSLRDRLLQDSEGTRRLFNRHDDVQNSNDVAKESWLRWIDYMDNPEWPWLSMRQKRWEEKAKEHARERLVDLGSNLGSGDPL